MEAVCQTFAKTSPSHIAWLPGKKREKFINVKEKLKEFRGEVQILDKNLLGDGGGKLTAGGGIKGLGHGGSSERKVHVTCKQPQRLEECRVCEILETEGEEGLYDGHFSTWPTGCPNCIQMSEDKKYRLAVKV